MKERRGLSLLFLGECLNVCPWIVYPQSTKTFIDYNIQHRKAFNTQRFQSKLTGSKDNVDTFSPTAFSNKEITQQIQRQRGHVFSTSDFRQKLLSNSKTMCTGFSTSDLRQKTQQFQRQCARVFPPATSAISRQCAQVFHQRPQTKYSAISKTGGQISSTQRFQAKTTNHIKRGDLQLLSPTRSQARQNPMRPHRSLIRFFFFTSIFPEENAGSFPPPREKQSHGPEFIYQKANLNTK